MTDRSQADLWRVTLCIHGPGCGMHARGDCGYAHSLQELLPPREIETLYPGVWVDGVDRFFGQQMYQHQLDRIFNKYLNNTHECEMPPWAKCLNWYFEGLDLCAFPECGWDFNIWQDVRLVSHSLDLPLSVRIGCDTRVSDL